MKIKKLLIKTLSISLIILSQSAGALTFKMPAKDVNILGELQKTRVGWGDTFHTIGRRFDVGYDAMASANPDFNSKELPLFYHVLVPSKFILPEAPRKGIVVNIAEKRLFYYDKSQNELYTFPVGVGKEGWATPVGEMHVIQKIKNPTWVAPDSILKALAKEGFKNVPAKIGPGPQDPLGDFAMRLSDPLYLIHGTNDPASIGTQASSGCIRLFGEDISQLFKVVPKGTPVRIVNEPYLLGWDKGALYMAVYPGLIQQKPLKLRQVERRILRDTHHANVKVDWRKVAYLVLNKNSIPEQITYAS